MNTTVAVYLSQTKTPAAKARVLSIRNIDEVDFHHRPTPLSGQ